MLGRGDGVGQGDGEDNPAQVGPISGGRGNKSGLNEAARQLGIERRDVQRSVRVASLSPEAQALESLTGDDDQ